MDSNDIADKVAPDLSRPGHGAGNSPLLGRKSVLMGMLTSGFLVAGAAHASSASAAPIKPGSVAATTSQYVSLWASATAYAVGQQVITPNSDVVTANIAHTSAAAYATDVAKWTLSSTYEQAKSLPINLTHPAFGGKVDGITDDSAAWVLAIAAANARQCAIYVPAGVSIVTRARAPAKSPVIRRL